MIAVSTSEQLLMESRARSGAPVASLTLKHVRRAPDGPWVPLYQLNLYGAMRRTLSAQDGLVLEVLFDLYAPKGAIIRRYRWR
jgi:hypothetical protein